MALAAGKCFQLFSYCSPSSYQSDCSDSKRGHGSEYLKNKYRRLNGNCKSVDVQGGTCAPFLHLYCQILYDTVIYVHLEPEGTTPFSTHSLLFDQLLHNTGQRGFHVCTLVRGMHSWIFMQNITYAE